MALGRLTSPRGVVISYDRYGSGPPLVLVHGSFSDHRTNWQFVKPLLEKQFSVYAVARRGRGHTTATEGHTLEDEGLDVAEVIHAVGEPVFLLGHSYGAQTALAASTRVPDRVRRLVLYEPPWPRTLEASALARFETLARDDAWEDLAIAFFKDTLSVPADDLAYLRTSEHWPPIVADAKASLGDVRALSWYDFAPERFRAVRAPVLLQVGSESPRDLYVTDALAAVLPDARIEELEGQAHEGMSTAPSMYAEAVRRFTDSAGGTGRSGARTTG